MFEKITWIYIEFFSARNARLCEGLQLAQLNKTFMYQEKDVVKVGIEAAIQLAQRDAVGVGNRHFEIPELADANVPPSATGGQGNEPFDGHRFNDNFQFFRGLHDHLVQFAGSNVIALEINVNRLAGASEESQRAAPNQQQA